MDGNGISGHIHTINLNQIWHHKEKKKIMKLFA